MKKIVLVTGATSGIGKATAELLGKNEYSVIVTGRRKDRLEDVKGILEKMNIEVLSLNLDVCNKDEVFQSIEELPNEWKQIDVLVNNAGLALGKSPIQDGDLDDWDRMIDTNVKGMLYLTKAVVPLMIMRTRGT